MTVAAIVLAGGKAAVSMPMSSLPDIQVPRVVIEATMAGLPAEEMRSLMAIPLEDGLASAKGLTRLCSVSRDGCTVLTLDFQWGHDSASAVGRVREIIDAIYPTLPDGADRPTVAPVDSGLEPLVISIAAAGGDLVAARHFADHELRSRMRRIEGVGSVTVIGGLQREMAVSVDMRKAAMRGLSVDDVARLLSREVADIPAGSLRDQGLELVVVAHGRPGSGLELANVVAAGPAGPVRLSDIAAVGERHAPRDSIFVANGAELVALEVYPGPGSDPVSGARRVKAAIADLSMRFHGDFDIRIVRDVSVPVASAIRSLALAGVVGSIAVALVLFVFLDDFLAGMLVALTIPVSTMAALGIVSLFGRSLNTMSLGGISLAIGMISDNAVVVLDALSTRFRGRLERPDADGIADAVCTTSIGTFGSTVTTAVVFMPVLFLPGAIGGLFGDMALSLLAATTGGWLCANFLVPSLYRFIWQSRCVSRIRKLERAYRRLLGMALRRPIVMLGIALCLASIGTIIVATRAISFLPADSANRLNLTVDFPPGTDPDGMAALAPLLSSALSIISGVQACYGGAGAEASDTKRHADPAYTRESLVLTCELRTHFDSGRLQSALLATANLMVPVNSTVRIASPPDQAARLLGLDGHACIAVRGATHAEANAAADSVMARLRTESGSCLLDARKTPSGQRTRIIVRPDKQALALLGLSAATISASLRTATAGVKVSTMELAGREAPVVVFASGAGYADRAGDLEEAARVPVFANESTMPVSAIARFDMQGSDASLARLDRADVVYIEPTAAPGAQARLDDAVDRVVRSGSGLARADESAFSRYAGAMIGSVILVVVLLYLTLGAQFESFRLPPLIMATIPLAMAGVGPALALSGLGLDSGSVLGLVVLFGVVVNNAILLYETTSARRLAGMKAAQAAYAGASERVRPILATTVTTMVALLPVCIMSHGATGRSMSVAMFGGVTASAALTLFVLPIVLAHGKRL
jgi:multidrug efflux pump subunit AcrB